MRVYILIIYLSFISSVAFSQNTWKAFRQLSCPEKRWVVFHPFVAKKAWKITLEARAATNEMKKDSVLDGDADGGQVDAFRHAYWMALLSQKMSWRKALALGRAHEKGNYRQFKKGKTDEENALPDSVSGAMDLFNNRIGAAIGCENYLLNSDSLKTLIIRAITFGKMRIISKNREGLPIDCFGNIIDFSMIKNRWGTPKCLIGSGFQRVK